MGRPKRSSSVSLDKALPRAAALSAIDPKLDLGNGLTLVAYRNKITNAQNKADVYNTLLSEVDAAALALEQAETTLSDWSDRMLAGVGSYYGKNSEEYEKAGGTRKEAIRRGPRPTAQSPAALKQAA